MFSVFQYYDFTISTGQAEQLQPIDHVPVFAMCWRMWWVHRLEPLYCIVKLGTPYDYISPIVGYHWMPSTSGFFHVEIWTSQSKYFYHYQNWIEHKNVPNIKLYLLTISLPASCNSMRLDSGILWYPNDFRKIT